MAGFSFGFAGDDIEDDGLDLQETAQQHVEQEDVPRIVTAPVTHRLEDLMEKLPSKIAWNVVRIESPQGRVLLLPRRELFDVRVQIMAEDDSLEGGSKIAGLDESDIRTNVYEGGFKSWECSYDLASLLLDRGPRKDIDDLCRVDHVIELGCGTAIPVSVLFHYALTQSLPLYFTFTDYNASVLELVTLPNLLLTYVLALASTKSPLFSDEEPNPFTDLSPEAHGYLDVTPELKDAFVNTLKQNSLNLTFLSGPWAPAQPFLNLIPTSPQMNTLVFASETIYSPSALKTFTTALVGILKEVRLGKAMVAAKRVYFGVGGSVDSFKIEASEQGAVVAEIENHGVDLGEGAGVRRCLLEVQMM